MVIFPVNDVGVKILEGYLMVLAIVKIMAAILQQTPVVPVVRVEIVLPAIADRR
jgi:uncharacterized membrane protein YjgN (DUF898 family)